MYGVVEVMVCLCGFHNNEIRAKLASEAAEPADFTSESAETRRFSFLQAQFSRRFRSQRSQPLSCWPGRPPHPGDEQRARKVESAVKDDIANVLPSLVGQFAERHVWADRRVVD